MKAERKIFTVTDLGPGDGGKGGVIHKICCEKKAHTVLKVGGAQGSHGVRTSRGESFNFSHFGCGTFEGVRTHITDRMVINPYGIVNEGNSLRYEHDIHNVFDLLTVDENCLCTIPYHGIASRLRELARKDHQKGTIGVGVGEAKKDQEKKPELAIYAKDLFSKDLLDKVHAVREYKAQELSSLISNELNFWEDDFELVREEVARLNDEGFEKWMLEQFLMFRNSVKLVDKEYLKKEILCRDGVTVVESSHGVLTDKYYGFHPYTSRLRTIPQVTWDMLHDLGYEEDIVRLAVTRAYQIRHGAGPLVTESKELGETLLPCSSKKENRYQGKVRVGPLDFVMLRYAVNVCGGPQVFDGMAVTWFDQILENGELLFSDHYWPSKHNDPEFISPEGEIIVKSGEDDAQLDRQARLANVLKKCMPMITKSWIPIRPDHSGPTELCTSLFQENLGIPVKMISFGPTEEDKVLL